MGKILPEPVGYGCLEEVSTQQGFLRKDMFSLMVVLGKEVKRNTLVVRKNSNGITKILCLNPYNMVQRGKIVAGGSIIESQVVWECSLCNEVSVCDEEGDGGGV
ncbi:peptidase [Striga asiatica]|uniref:Peptidase n=1 Tax=Striga asiatica TaxID=4170 RepID=A0A5A7R813_STRAF|nr:peptidase [Striga asiatica]